MGGEERRRGEDDIGEKREKREGGRELKGGERKE